jgi:DNA polymerase V
MIPKLTAITRVSQRYTPQFDCSRSIPFYTCPVSAGFPSPAEDYIEGKLDLNRYLIHNPVATFFVRVTGDSMIGAGIHSGDLLVVDRSLHPSDGMVAIAVVNGEVLVKRLQTIRGKTHLVAENPDYPPLEIKEEMDFQIWGVATSVIHPL